ncbi:MAG: hypothetical protein J5379_02000 [Clostridiales bacterium]|nr:hypothetical protein [Clostridiales bacterium]
MNNIEDLLTELGQDLQYEPEKLNTGTMRKSMVRRRAFHYIAVAGRSVVIAAASLFLVLFVGVNTSVKFARAASDVPVIGTISKSIIIRDDIKEALTDHEDLEKPIEAGHLIPINCTVSGDNYAVDLTLDSILIDEHALTAFIKIDTDMLPEGFFTILTPHVVDLNTGKEIEVILDGKIFEESGELYLFRFYWESYCTDFTLDFDLVDENIDYTGWTVLQHYHFVIEGVQPPETHHIPIDQTLTFEGYDFHFVELQISDTGTKIIYSVPPEKTIGFGYLSMTVEDEEGNVIADNLLGSIGTYYITGDDGTRYCAELLSSIYYEDISKVRIHIHSCYCELFEEEILTVDPISKTGTFKGQTFPIEVYGPEKSHTEFGLSDKYDSYYDWTREYVLIFLVPVMDGMPDFNSLRFKGDRESIYEYEYPKTTINGQEYFVIQQISWDKDEDDTCHYYVHGKNYETYPFDNVIELSI